MCGKQAKGGTGRRANKQMMPNNKQVVIEFVIEPTKYPSFLALTLQSSGAMNAVV